MTDGGGGRERLPVSENMGTFELLKPGSVYRAFPCYCTCRLILTSVIQGACEEVTGMPSHTREKNLSLKPMPSEQLSSQAGAAGSLWFTCLLLLAGLSFL